MVHIDEKFKDNSPIKTVENIRALLEKHGLCVEENWNDSGITHCHSLRVKVAGTTFGANGKGVSKELARASGHAELMERLQSGFCGVGGLEFPDAVFVSREEQLKTCGTYFAQIAEHIQFFEDAPLTAEDLADAAVGYGEVDPSICVPFLDVLTGKTVPLPYFLIVNLYGTNGLAAGNSTQEAIVQGFSEIVERYCQRYFLEGKLTPPDVPEDYLAKCTTAYSVIQQVREKGFDVIVKDCSLGEGYPVVASAIINKTDRSARVMFGASPIFEIALERSLTEVFQGYALDRMPFIQGFFVGKKRTKETINTAFVGGWVNYPYEFYAEKPSYEFKPFADRTGMSNKDLLDYIVQYLKKKNRTMLIRDLSHLGFHTYRIIVPGMSDLYTFNYIGEPSLAKLNVLSREHRNNLKKASKEELCAYKQVFQTMPVDRGGIPTFRNMTKIPLQLEPQQEKCLTLLSVAYAEWATEDPQQALDYALRAAKYAGGKLKTLLECLCQMLKIMQNGKTSDEAVELMARFYDPFLLEMTRRSCESENPFENFIFTCDLACEACPHSGKCAHPSNAKLTAKINEAVAAFDIEAAFDRLRACFE